MPRGMLTSVEITPISDETKRQMGVDLEVGMSQVTVTAITTHETKVSEKGKTATALYAKQAIAGNRVLHPDHDTEVVLSVSHRLTNGLGNSKGTAQIAADLNAAVAADEANGKRKKKKSRRHNGRQAQAAQTA